MDMVAEMQLSSPLFRHKLMFSQSHSYSDRIGANKETRDPIERSSLFFFLFSGGYHFLFISQGISSFIYPSIERTILGSSFFFVAVP